MWSNVTIDPPPAKVREAITTILDPEVQIFCKSLYVLGASPVELTGDECTGEKAYGPKGDELTLFEYLPVGINRETTELILQDKLTLNQAFAPIKIAIFKIGIARQRLKKNEQPPFRNVALPADSVLEPWTQEICECYQRANGKPVFPYNRKHYLDYLRQRHIFKNFKYTVESYPRYAFAKSGKRVQLKPASSHPKNFGLEGLRKTRRKELRDFFGFTDFEIDVFSGVPYKYGNLSEHYELYLAKLLKEKAGRDSE
jgi:hypothetical protein